MDDYQICIEEIKKQEKLIYEAKLNEIKNKTCNIHAAFLFWYIGERLLQKICRILYDAPIKQCKGWVELSYKIGLDRFSIKSIENVHIMNEDPVYIMLMAYSQNDNATIGRIYEALDQLERKDIITETYPNVLEIYDEICKSFNIPTDHILKPTKIPVPPHIFKNLKFEDVKIDDKLAGLKKKKIFSRIVMLTYVSEDASIAKTIENELKKERNRKIIGVIALNNHQHDVITEREKLILKFYTSSHYIIPIVTINYLNKIANTKPLHSIIGNLDDLYASFLYGLMTHQYLSSGCKNKKIRCIIPDDDFLNVQDHYIFNHPIFQAWTKFSHISDMAQNMIDNKI